MLRIERTARPLVVLVTVSVVVLIVAAVIRRIDWSYGADTGTFVRIILDVPHGMRDALEGGSHFRYHDSPTLALLWPLLALLPDPITLQIVQIVATIATTPLVVALVRPFLGPALAVRVGILTLLYPPLLALGFNEFHEVGLFTPLAVGMLLAADRRCWIAYAACVALLLGIREDVCLTIGIAGAAFAAFGTPAGRDRGVAIAGIATAVAAFAVDATYYGLIAPRLGGWAPAHFYVYPFANGPAALLAAPFVHPLAFARAMGAPGRLSYLLEALVPLAFLPLRSAWSLLALPGFAVVLLANDPLVWDMGQHYAALWIPWLVVGSAFAVAALAQRSPRVATRWLTTAIALSALTLVVADPAHPGHYLKPNYRDLAAARAAIACVPRDALFSTHDEWYTAVAAQRPHTTLYAVDGVPYLVYADDFPNAHFRDVMLPAIRREVAAGTYRVICTYGDVRTYAATTR